MMWYWNSGGVHWWSWFVSFAIMIGFWGLIIFLLVSLFRSIAAKDLSHEPSGNEDSERTLARRFANGEIDEEEFHRRLEVLRSDCFADKT